MPLAEWLDLRFPSSGLWIHIPLSGSVCTYWWVAKWLNKLLRPLGLGTLLADRRMVPHMLNSSVF